MDEMTLPRDPVMLLSVINTRLRDSYPSLDALADAMEADEKEIQDKLKGIGYTYDARVNQFVR